MKKMIRFFVCLSTLLLITSCSWEKPETVAVKTNASYNFAIGNLDKSLDELIDLKSILNSEKSEISVYDYFPGKSDATVQQFLMTVKVIETDLKDIDIGGGQLLSTAISAIPAGTSLDLSNLSAYGISSLEVTGKQELDFNPTELLNSMSDALGDDFSNKVTFASVPVYLYCNINEGLSADAKIKTYYGLKDGTKAPVSPNPYDFYVAGSSTEFAVIANSSLPDLTPEEETSAVVINLEDETYSYKNDITEIMNNSKNVSVTDAQLCLDYDLKLKGTIAKDKITDGSAKLQVYVGVVLPIKFKVLSDINLDIRQMTGADKDSDIFQRADANGFDEQTSNILGAIRSASLNYSTNATPIVSNPSVKFAIDMLGNGEYNVYEITEGSFVMTFDYLQEMLETYPLCPNLEMRVVKDSIFTMPRKRDVKMNLSASVITDGIVPLF